MGRVRRVLRWILLGRRSGTRARVRRTLGVLTWMDRRAAKEEGGRRTPHPSPRADGASDTGWVDTVGVEELSEGALIEVVLGDRTLVLAKVDGSYFAIDGVCPHAGGALGDGFLEEGVLTCARHGWTFDVRSGDCQIDPEARIGCYETRLVEGRVQVLMTAGVDED